METWSWIVLIALIVVLGAALFAWFRQRQRSGSVRAAEREQDQT